MALQIGSPLEWAHELEKELGVAQSPNNDEVLVAWAAVEGGNWHNSAFANVLGTTKREPGSTSINSVGVQRYTSWEEGLSATVSMIRQKNMSGILASLKANASPTATAHAIGESPWVSGHTHNPAYESAIDRALGRNYDPTQKATPAPTSAAGSPALQEASLLSLNPLTDLKNFFGLGGSIAGGAAGALSSGAADIAEGITAPIIRWVDSIAVRAALILLGTIALIVGISGLFDTGSVQLIGSSSDEDVPSGPSTSSGRAPAPKSPTSSRSSSSGSKSSSKGKRGGVASDVDTTAEGAAEAL